MVVNSFFFQAAVPLIVAGLAGQALSDTVTLTASRDATLYEDAEGDRANGSGQYLFVGRTGQPQTRRALIAFAIDASIPGDATITMATLALNLSKTPASARTATLHRVLADWGEGSSNAASQEGDGTTAATGDATWLHTFYNTQTWTSAGGDFEAGSSASRSISGAGPYTWSSAGMVTDVQAWLDDPSTNFGWMIRGDESGSKTAKRFDSREHPTAANRPTLTIEFELPVANQAPVVAGALADTSVVAGNTLRFALDSLGVFTDADGDSLSYSAVVEGDAVSAEVMTGVLTIVGLIEGSATVTLTADDGNDESTSMAFTVTVEAVNAAPEVVHDPCDVTLVPLSGVATGDLGQLFIDADLDSLLYSVHSSADSLVTAAVEASTLMLTPLAGGQSTITVTATDPTGATASLSFSIIVSAQVLLGDFVANGAVDFDDFFLFADNFGRTEADDDWDPAIDIVANGAIDFDDFFLFADNFGLQPEPEPPVLLDWCLGQ